MSQLRLNPLTGRWVTVVAERGERPTDFAPRVPQVEGGPSRPCPFCPGNEEATLPALETYGRNGRWQIRVVPNLYPAFYGDEPMAVSHQGPVFTHATASGIHEVVVFSPEHDAALADLDDRDVGLVMAAIRDRMDDHARSPRIRYSQAVVNFGREAGASLAHPHGQLLGMPFVPGEILEEEAGFNRFEGSCLICTTIDAELSDGDRLVYEDEQTVVVCPYWSGSPYELLIMPKEHVTHLQHASPIDLVSVGRSIRTVLANLRDHLGDVAYNIVFHTAPHRHDGQFHWHVHIWPKLATIAGFERGTGVLINIVPPEVAAQALRRVAGRVPA